jgi:hypothetical protein
VTKKSSTDTRAPRIDAAGLPVLTFQSMGSGTCPVCFHAAHVGTHKRNGYFLRCLSCGLTLFTRTPAGSITFRAQQDVLADADLRRTLTQLNIERFVGHMDSMFPPAEPPEGGPKGSPNGEPSV